jgi:hypothetical protein
VLRRLARVRVVTQLHATHSQRGASGVDAAVATTVVHATAAGPQYGVRLDCASAAGRVTHAHTARHERRRRRVRCLGVRQALPLRHPRLARPPVAPATVVAAVNAASGVVGRLLWVEPRLVRVVRSVALLLPPTIAADATGAAGATPLLAEHGALPRAPAVPDVAPVRNAAPRVRLLPWLAARWRRGPVARRRRLATSAAAVIVVIVTALAAPARTARVPRGRLRGGARALMQRAFPRAVVVVRRWAEARRRRWSCGGVLQLLQPPRGAVQISSEARRQSRPRRLACLPRRAGRTGVSGRQRRAAVARRGLQACVG